MAKEKKSASNAQGKVADAAEVKNEGLKTKPFELETTDGKRITSAYVKSDKKNTLWVNATYVEQGKDKKDGVKLVRPLTEEQARAFVQLPEEQKMDFAVRAAFPMHVDGKAFNATVGEVDGEAYDYAFVEKITEDVAARKYAYKKDGISIDAKDADAIEHYKGIIAALPEDERNEVYKNVGKETANIGVKGGVKHSSILTVNDQQSLRLRADVKAHTEAVDPNKPNGKKRVVIDSVGAPMTKAAILMRSVKASEKYQAQREKVKTIDWSKYTVPAGVKLTGLKSFNPTKPEQAGRLGLQGKVNGVSVTAILSPNESVALRDGVITKEQAAMANREFSSRVNSIAGLSVGNDQRPGLKP